ncbi:DUF748 domain-containing protein [Marinomonas ostreistagni]|uniref:DUF748 domain-containing protein n=1 Tax=Marinomonas ostreistagni TaxID=359209 RepID=UPI001950BFF6|nr:DUF748 domain-containing protein [Marinomonas ostreistagni]MBM6551763.1 DUF748 domain-containing protein [Marinomonas ostreistagni]
MTNFLDKLSPRQRKIIIGVAATLITLTVIWLLIPTVTKWLANRYLADHNAVLTAEEINPDLFPIGLELADVQITQQDQTTFSLDTLSIGLDFWPLFTGAFHVNHILVDNFDIQVAQTPDGWAVAGVPLPPASEEEPVEETPEDAEQTLAPSFLLTNASLKDIQVQLNTERGQDVLAIQNLAVEEASHFDANWQGNFNLTALVNDAEATVNGTISADREQVDADMQIASAALSTNDIDHFLPASRPQLSAQNVRLTGNVKALYQFNQAPLLNLTSPSLALSSDRVAYTEKAQEMGWQALETELTDVTVTMENETDLRATTSNTLAIKGLNIASESQQLSADELNFSAQLALTKQQSDIVVQESAAKLSGKAIKGGLAGHQFGADGLDLDVSDVNVSYDTETAVGNVATGIKLQSQGVNGRLATGDQFALQSINLNSPLELSLSEQGTLVNTTKTALTLGATEYSNEQINAALDSFKLDLNQFSFEQQNDGLSLAAQQMALDVQQSNVKSPSLDGTLNALNLQLDDVNLRQASDVLGIHAKTTLAATALDATAKDLPSGQPDTDIAFDSLAFNSQLSWEQSSDQSLLQAANNNLNLDQIQVTQDDTLSALLEQFNFNNETARVTLPQDAAVIVETSNNSLTLAALRSQLEDGSTLLNWQGVKLNSPSASLSASGPDAQISGLVIDQLVASQPNESTGLPALAQFEQLAVNRLHARPQGVEIDKVNFDKLKAGMVLSQQREVANLTLPKWLQGDAQSSSTEAQPSASNQTAGSTSPGAQPVEVPYHVIVNELTLSPESSALFTDNGISPSLTRVLDIEQLKVTNFNTRDTNEYANINLKARNGNYATIESDVAIRPMAQNLTMQATAKVREVELPPISPYVSSALGYRINSGHLNMDLALDSDQGELDGNTHIVLRQFELGGQKDSNALLKVGAVPLDLAVDALKNRNDEIVLDLPMSGNIDNPNFQWQSFFLLPIRQGLFKASSAYLMQTFVPYANVITLVQFAGEQALKLRVEPLQFALDEEDITAPEQEAFLDQMITLMKDRKGAQLRACGVSVVRDIDDETPYDALTEEQRSELLELADERAETLKAYLVDNGIQSSRVFLCSPSIDEDDNALPRVTFSF